MAAGERRRDIGRAAEVLAALAGTGAEVREASAAEGVLGVQPSLVAAPGSVEEAAAVLRVAAEHSLAVVPRGGETRLDWGPPPTACDLLVDTSRLDRIVEHAAGDLIVTAQAGVPMEALAERLAAAGQRLALDAPLPGSTIGGTVATGAAGPLRLLYGAPRDLLIGITFVRADGAVAKSGGKVVKNVAGYDLGKLLAGSLGTLGLIVEATFRLHPLPAATAYVRRSFGRAAAVREAVLAAAHSPAVPSAVEVDVRAGVATVAVLVEGTAESVPGRAGRIAGLLGDGAEITAGPPPWWGAYPDGTTLVEVVTEPGASHPDLPDFAVRGSAALGLWHAAAGPDLPVADLQRVLADLRRDHRRATVRYAPEKVRDSLDMWGPVPALALNRRIKAQFDPGHRLSPGRFAGGI